MTLFKKYGRGFTLIELLVVIAIIGILSSVVLASLNDARMKSRDAKRIADLKQIQLALELFFDATGGYPTSAQFTTAGTGNLTPTYMATLPKDPTTGANYAYAGLAASGTACTSYHIGASLEQTSNAVLASDNDGTAGTACTGGGTDFSGLATTGTTGTPPPSCSGTAGTAQPGGTETCFDIKP